MPNLTLTEVETVLHETVASFPHDPCLTCECFLGLVARLRLDAGAESQPLLDTYKVPRQEMHSCLGCDPCPPGNRYAQYIQQKQAAKLITL
ncbi:MAG: hypothetical protein NT121_12905 [Chloroflexi bacterium]|nr:hypothetical protein [Chloroflexota bacterium]